MNESQLKRIAEAASILADLGLPRDQYNERSALVFLALLDLGADQPWAAAGNPLRRVFDLIEFMRSRYERAYAVGAGETIRKESIHQFVDAGLLLKNPDRPDRPTNSPQTVYQLDPILIELVRGYGGAGWSQQLERYRTTLSSLRDRYARERRLVKVPVRLPGGSTLHLSAGGQSLLIKRVLDDFCAYYTPDAEVIYVGDTAEKWACFDVEGLRALGVESPEKHGRMPDLVIYLRSRGWLVLIEAVDSRGPVDAKRRNELERLFLGSRAGLVFVSAFADRKTAARFLPTIAWETEVWVADAPTHLIHFDGERFLGPYGQPDR